MDSFIENNDYYNFNINDYKKKSLNVVNNDSTISKFIISNVASTTLNYYIKGLKKDVNIDEIDIGMKKLILLSDSNEYLIKSMKNNEFNLNDISNEDLIYMRQESGFSRLEPSLFDYVDNGALLLSNINYVAVYDKKLDDVENNYLKIKQFFIDKIKINFDNSKDILF